MIENRPRTGPYAIVERIRHATNAHDLDALVDCFTSDYESAWPIHPARTFVGTEQVRRNWEQIFHTVPDVRIEVVDFAESGDDVWTEWEFAGNRLDGEPFLMRGVIVMHVEDGRATRARFFLEPVDTDAVDASAAVRRLLGS